MIWILLIIGLITIFTYQKKDRTLKQQVDSYGGMGEKYKYLIDKFENQPDTEIVKISRDEVIINNTCKSTDNFILITELYREFQVIWTLNIAGTERHKKEWKFPETYPQDKIYHILKEHIDWKFKDIFGDDYKSSCKTEMKSIENVSNDNLLNSKWDSIIELEGVDDSFKKVINAFLKKDNISVERFIENQKANEICKTYGLKNWEKAQSLSAYENKEVINCTKTFRDNFADNILNRSPDLVDWFYIAYPDVQVWFDEVKLYYQIIIKQNGEKYFSNGKVNYEFYRLIIDDYLKSNSILECSNKIPYGLTKDEYLEVLMWEQSGETPYD